MKLAIDLFKFCFVYSGQTESNNSYVVCGQANDPLTPVGQDQARAAGAALADKKFDKVYASPLERTLNTCKAIVGEIKFSAFIKGRLFQQTK